MKFRYTLLLVAMCSISTAWGKVSIRGKIQGYDGESLVYYHPTLEGVFSPYWRELKPDLNGNFRIEFENAGYGNTRVSYKHIVYRFFHDSDSEIYVEINDMPKRTGPAKRIPGERIFLVTDSLKQAMTRKITGDYEQINRFYNSTLRSSHYTNNLVDGTYYSRLISKAATPARAMTLIDSLADAEIRQINQLPWHLHTEGTDLEAKDKEIREYLVGEVHAFYAGVFLNAMFLKRKEQVLQQMADSTATPDVYNRAWEELIEKLAADMKTGMKPMPGSPDYTDLLEIITYTLADYKKYYFPQTLEKSLDEMMVDRLFHHDTTLIKDKKAQFAHELRGLQVYLNDQMYFSPALLHAAYALQAKYPESKHMEFFEPKIAKLKASVEASGKPFDDGKLIRANHHTFEDLLKRFEGKNILVDIWATWCHPCIEDFQYKAEITAFAERGELEVLYISIDKPQWEDRWRNSIKINRLAGHHFRANTKFTEDMWRTIGGYEGAIPRYVLIDKHGKIYKNTAARPGSGTELTTEIRQMIDQK